MNYYNNIEFPFSLPPNFDPNWTHDDDVCTMHFCLTLPPSVAGGKVESHLIFNISGESKSQNGILLLFADVDIIFIAWFVFWSNLKTLI